MSKSEITNLNQYDVSRIHENCTVVTLDGLPGFAWYDRYGQLHNEGLTFPKMNIIREAKVQLLYNSETGERSAGWSKKNTGGTDYTETDGDM